ncbi:unnamed protein product, partial [Amoebophrya sp. A120]
IFSPVVGTKSAHSTSSPPGAGGRNFKSGPQEHKASSPLMLKDAASPKKMKGGRAAVRAGGAGGIMRGKSTSPPAEHDRPTRRSQQDHMTNPLLTTKADETWRSSPTSRATNLDKNGTSSKTSRSKSASKQKDPAVHPRKPLQSWSKVSQAQPIQGLGPEALVRRVACGGQSCALIVQQANTNETALFTWGKGSSGILGHGNYDDVFVPRRVQLNHLASKTSVTSSNGGSFSGMSHGTTAHQKTCSKQKSGSKSKLHAGGAAAPSTTIPGEQKQQAGRQEIITPAAQHINFSVSQVACGRAHMLVSVMGSRTTSITTNGSSDGGVHLRVATSAEQLQPGSFEQDSSFVLSCGHPDDGRLGRSSGKSNLLLPIEEPIKSSSSCQEGNNGKDRDHDLHRAGGTKVTKTTTSSADDDGDLLIDVEQAGGNQDHVHFGGRRAKEMNKQQVVLKRQEPPSSQTIFARYLATGGAHSGFIEKSLSVYTWGCNRFGQLGLGYAGGFYQEKPRKVRFFDGKGVCSLSLGERHSCALTLYGLVYAFGANDKEQLFGGVMSTAGAPGSCAGAATTPKEQFGVVYNLPHLVQPLITRPVLQVACGEQHTFVLSGPRYQAQSLAKLKEWASFLLKKDEVKRSQCERIFEAELRKETLENKTGGELSAALGENNSKMLNHCGAGGTTAVGGTSEQTSRKRPMTGEQVRMDGKKFASAAAKSDASWRGSAGGKKGSDARFHLPVQRKKTRARVGKSQNAERNPDSEIFGVDFESRNSLGRACAAKSTASKNTGCKGLDGAIEKIAATKKQGDGEKDESPSENMNSLVTAKVVNEIWLEKRQNYFSFSTRAGRGNMTNAGNQSESGSKCRGSTSAVYVPALDVTVFPKFGLKEEQEEMMTKNPEA